MPVKSPSASTTNADEDVDLLNIIGSINSSESSVQGVNVSSPVWTMFIALCLFLLLPLCSLFLHYLIFIIAPISLSTTALLTSINWSKFHAEWKGTFRTVLNLFYYLFQNIHIWNMFKLLLGNMFNPCYILQFRMFCAILRSTC